MYWERGHPCPHACRKAIRTAALPRECAEGLCPSVKGSKIIWGSAPEIAGLGVAPCFIVHLTERRSLSARSYGLAAKKGARFEPAQKSFIYLP
jgi:hypothetical protein